MTRIVVDASYLVYRSQYAMKDETDPLFAFFATVVNLRERFDSDSFVFCFDRGKLKRCDLLPTYKTREGKDPEHEEARRMAKDLMRRLRVSILPGLGFENLLSQQGYEADDIIASVVMDLPKDDDAVIVSTDGDLLQLLGENVIIYNPNKQLITNEDSFKQKWNLDPSQWAVVKAMAGCHSDNIQGIRGVGEKTAAQYLNGTLQKYSARWFKIHEANKEEINFRLGLVKLPFEGTQKFILSDQEKVNWRRIQTYSPGKT